MALRRAGLHHAESLFGAGVLGDGLGSFRDGMFGQFTGEEEPDGGLNFPWSNETSFLSPENEKKELVKLSRGTLKDHYVTKSVVKKGNYLKILRPF